MLRSINIRCIIRANYTAPSITSTCSYSIPSSSAVNINSDPAPENQSSSPSKEDPSKLVAAAFASLKEISLQSKKGPKLTYAILDAKIAKARDVNTLLGVVENDFISRPSAFKIVSILSDWANSGRVKLSDFETDPRFITVCSLLSRKGNEDVGDLSLVLGITGDDQAAKLVSSISVTQMVKVMSSLCSKRRRSVPLLRSLSFNIGRSDERLNIKDSADVLYACAVLNFPDEILIEKVSSDICSCIGHNKKPAVIGSIITSLGFLRYRNQDLLEELLHWMIQNYYACRIQEFIAILLTLANVNYTSETFDQLYIKMKNHVQVREVNNYYTWLDVVWSLIVLNKAESHHLTTVLSSDFISKVLQQIDPTLYVTEKMKLLNINGAVKLNKHLYEDVILLEDPRSVNVCLTRTKEKQTLVDSVRDTLSNILPSSSYANYDVDTGMGYLIDAEFLMNSDGKFLPPSSQTTDLSSTTSSESTRIALLVHSYHDVCRGCHNELAGISHLIQRLTTESGYKILSVPYTEYNSKSNLLDRVQYLEKKIKSLFPCNS